jgi:hypothetical protein
MNIEQLSTMTEADLQATADRHLLIIDGQYTSDMEKQYHVSQAQFFLAELDRRKQTQERVESGKIADRDYKLEKWVIWLIGAELVLAVVGLLFGWIEGAKQTKVLDQLNQSGAATAATLTALQKAQEASLDTQQHTLDNIITMNNALQDQLDQNLTGAIQYGGGMSGNGIYRVNLDNNGKDVLSLWGNKFGNNSPAMKKQPTILNPGDSVTLDISDLIAKAQKQQGSSGLNIPIELYLTRDDGTKYVAKGTILGNGYIPHMTTTRKQW